MARLKWNSFLVPSCGGVKNVGMGDIISNYPSIDNYRSIIFLYHYQ